MFKFTDAAQMGQKKITRNNNMYETIDLWQKLIDIEIIVKERIKAHYENQKNVLKSINEIETLQCSEYTADRQDTINELMKSVGNIKLLDISDLNEQSKLIKEQINHKTTIINQLQELIPKKGIATNYSINTNNSTQTCSSSERFI